MRFESITFFCNDPIIFFERRLFVIYHCITIVFQWQQVVGTPAFMRSQIYKNEFATDICICWKVSQVKSDLKVIFFCKKEDHIYKPITSLCTTFSTSKCTCSLFCVFCFFFHDVCFVLKLHFIPIVIIICAQGANINLYDI